MDLFLYYKNLINLRVSIPKSGATLNKSFFLKLGFLSFIVGIFSLRPRHVTVMVLANFGVVVLYQPRQVIIIINWKINRLKEENNSILLQKALEPHYIH